jgi:hypothetical protein
MALRMVLTLAVGALGVIAGTQLARPGEIPADPVLSSRLQRTDERLAGVERRIATSQRSEVQRALGSDTTPAWMPAPTAPNPEAPARESDVIADLEDALEIEGSDPIWSKAAERDLLVAYDGSKIEGSRVDGVRCAATFCRMTVSHDDEEASLAFRQRVALANPFPKSSVLVNQRIDARGQASSLVFVARSEHGLAPQSAGP